MKPKDNFDRSLQVSYSARPHVEKLARLLDASVTDIKWHGDTNDADYTLLLSNGSKWKVESKYYTKANYGHNCCLEVLNNAGTIGWAVDLNKTADLIIFSWADGSTFVAPHNQLRSLTILLQDKWAKKYGCFCAETSTGRFIPVPAGVVKKELEEKYGMELFYNPLVFRL